MTCSKCGSFVEEGSKFCPICGENLEEVVVVEVSSKPARCWDVFAKLGYGLGLASLIGFFIFLGLGLGVPAIVFSCLGRKSVEFKNKAKTGLVLSILGTALSFVAYVILIVIATALEL